jgi:hypothetical protein
MHNYNARDVEGIPMAFFKEEENIFDFKTH